MSDKQAHKDMTLIKNTAILAGWIAGLIILAGLIWFFTQPVRNRIMLNAVNQVLEHSGDTRRLDAPLSPGMITPGLHRTGSWYTMAGQTANRVFVFAFTAEGTFFPCAAVVTPEGNVEEFIPLNNHAERMLKRLSPEIIKLYTRRIEGAGS